MSSVYISPADGGAGKRGGGPDDPARTGPIFTRSQGFLMLAFGLALGLTCMIFFTIFHYYDNLIANFAGLQSFVKELRPNIWLSFVFGFVCGTVLSGIYNILVVRRLNLLGLESVVD